MPTAPHKFELERKHKQSLARVVENLFERFLTVDDEEFLNAVKMATLGLNNGIHESFHEFASQDYNGALLVTGLTIPDTCIGRTPNFTTPNDLGTVLEDMRYHVLAALLGNAFGWASYLDGRVLNHVVPQRGLEQDQTSKGSIAPLLLHSEEAYHELRPDYVGLMCLRNHNQVATTLVQACDLDLDFSVIAQLMEPQYIIRQDTGHDAPTVDPEPIALLYGDESEPYLRVDPAYTDEPLTSSAKIAYGSLLAQIEEHKQPVILQPGEMLFLNNHRTIHGRDAFTPKYDGTDRWLKRLWLTVDLRKSRARRDTATSRVIH